VRRFAGAVTAVIGSGALILPASPASAATQLGETFTPPSGCPSAPSTVLQSSSPGQSYAAPAAGVITSWSFQAGPSPPQLKFKVARSAGGDNFTIVGESTLQTPNPNVLNTFPVQIPVAARDVIGIHIATSGGCFQSFIDGAPSDYGYHRASGDPPPGTTAAFAPAQIGRFDISALLEPDCDKDGFGDETQDSDLSGCAPNTTITKGPKQKTKKKTATFEFAATSGLAARQGAPTFQCKLDSGPFEPCTSPKTYRVKKGKHTFQVQATLDGFTDSTPATDDWKRKRRKKQ
jgi:hypothetical protein